MLTGWQRGNCLAVWEILGIFRNTAWSFYLNKFVYSQPLQVFEHGETAFKIGLQDTTVTQRYSIRRNSVVELNGMPGTSWPVHWLSECIPMTNKYLFSHQLLAHVRAHITIQLNTSTVYTDVPVLNIIHQGHNFIEPNTRKVRLRQEVRKG